MTKTVGCFFAILLVVAVTLVGQSTLYVPDDYPTIQAAIDAAQPGDTVLVHAGRYVENLAITRPLHLVGEDRGAVWVEAENPGQPVIEVGLDSGKVTIRELSVRKGGLHVEVGRAARVSVDRVRVVGNTFGVRVQGPGTVAITDSLLVDNWCGLYTSAGQTELVGLEISRGRVGILLSGGGTTRIEGCLIGLAEHAIDTYTTGCGWKGAAGFTGEVVGRGNKVFGHKVFGVSSDLCPEYPGDPWPKGFVNEAWRRTVEKAVADLKRGGEAYRAQDYAGAAEAYERALEGVVLHAPFPLLEAYICQDIGVVYKELGRYEEALEAYSRAREVYAKRGLEAAVAVVDGNIGVVYKELGRYEEALAAYRRAREVFAKHDIFEVDVAKIDQNIGIVYTELGRYEEALAAYRRAREVFAKHGKEIDLAAINMEVNVAMVDGNIGVVYKELGRYEEALEAYRRAREVYVKRGLEVNVAMVDENIGIVYYELGRYEDALEACTAARAVYVSHGMDVDVARIDTNIGVVYYALGRYEDAFASYQEALGILDQVPPIAGMKYSYPATRWMILNNEGVCYEKRSNWDAAVKAYEDSIAVIESLRGYMKSHEIKSAWQERTQDVYERLIKLLIEHGQGSNAFPYAERCRARTFLDALYQGSIAPNQLISPEAGISSGAVDPKAVDAAVKDARESLQPNEAVLEYMVTDSGVYLWVITKEGVSDPIFIEYEREQLMNDVITLRKNLESASPDVVALTTALTSFYTKLVQPGLDELTGKKIDTLILIPSGPLWYLPFSAVQVFDQEEGTTRYLIERYTIAYLPSLASLPSLTREREETQVAGGPVLALADPEVSEQQLQEGESSKCVIKPLARYPRLVEAAQAFANELLGGDTGERYVYAGNKAQEGIAYDVEGEKVEVYAAHGQFNPKVPLQSKLLLAPSESGTAVQTDPRNPDGNYHAWEVLLTDHRGTELVVLAACESLLPHLGEMEGTMAVLGDKECSEVKLTPQQLEQIVVGDEVVGLARAFLSSGAEAVLGTLWLANPTAIGKLLTSMADYHNQGNTWAQALTKAQRDLIKDRSFSDPWLWAPYQLIGRWR